MRPDDASAGFGGGLGWGRSPAVLVIDMARAYFTPGADLDLGSRACLDSVSVRAKRGAS